MRRAPVLLTVVAMAGLPTAADAAWGPAVSLPTRIPAYQTVVAPGARGDAIVAWIEEDGRAHRQSVRAAYLRPGARSATVRTLAAPAPSSIWGLTAALDRRGEPTVVWVARRSDAGLLRGHITVRASWRATSGRWSATQDVARVSPHYYAQPRLATSPTGRVALTVNAGTRAAPGVGVAWRRPGRRFGSLSAVMRGYLFEPSLVFDARGRVTLAGIAACDDESASHGVLATAPGVGRRFGAPITIAPAPAHHLRLTLAADGASVATWLRTGCSTSEDLSGPPMVATVGAGGVTVPSSLSDATGRAPTAVRAPGGAVDVSWTGFPTSAPNGALLSTRVQAGPPPTAAPATDVTGGWRAAAGDPNGDQVLVTARAEGLIGSTAVSARTADGTLEPSPLPAVSWPVAAAAPDGSTLAAVAPGTRSLRVSVWRPAR